MSGIVITCPDCNTRYRATAQSLGDDGRNVRCVKCESTWYVPAPDVIDALVADPDALALADNVASETSLPLITEPGLSGASAGFGTNAGEVGQAPPSRTESNVGADVMMRDHVDREKLTRRRRTIRFIWAVPVVLVIVAAIIAYFNRQAIVNRIPQMASVYQTIGIEVRAGGLEIDPPHARTVLVDGEPVIRVESVVRNLTRRVKTVPMIELTLHDIDGEALVQWYVDPDPNLIEPRGRLVFTSEITSPPDGAVGLRYKFSDDVEQIAAR